MKNISIIALILVLVLGLAACGKKNMTPDTTVPTTDNSVLPEMDPTMDTNIPDDKVNGNSTDTTDSTGSVTDPSNSADPTIPDATVK